MVSHSCEDAHELSVHISTQMIVYKICRNRAFLLKGVEKNYSLSTIRCVYFWFILLNFEYYKFCVAVYVYDFPTLKGKHIFPITILPKIIWTPRLF